jgi:DNA-binding PadR family transcriptional regulator
MARRMFGHGELHLVVLALLQREPMHGYQLLGDLARLFAPGYKPSPGSLYPSLQALADVGLISGADDGGRKVYRLTDDGHDALNKRRSELHALEARTGVRVSPSPDLEAVLADFATRIRRDAASAPLEDVQALLDQTADQICSLPTGRTHTRSTT